MFYDFHFWMQNEFILFNVINGPFISVPKSGSHMNDSFSFKLGFYSAVYLLEIFV